MTRLATCFLVSLALLTFRSYGAEIEEDEGVVNLHWTDAESAIGQVAYVCGKVIDVRNIGSITFINFDTERPARFAGVVFRDNYGKFPNDLKKMYDGKLVMLRGQISTHRDRPQIVLSSPKQVTIVDKLPETAQPKQEQATGTSGQLVVATYNVLNLFDEVDDPYTADETTPFKSREDMEHLAAGIRRLNADVVALQEVESRGYLRRFVKVFLSDMGYRNVVHYEGNDLRGIDVCLLSRVPVGPVCSHRHVTYTDQAGNPRRMSRDLLQVKLLPEGNQPLEVWLLHLKSNSGGREYSEPVRLAETRYVRKQLDDRLAKEPDARILLMGDFNDTWHSATLKMLVGEGSTAMQLPLSEEARASLITYNKPPRLSMIDFILCSPAMAKNYVPNTYRSIPGETQVSGSDHNPVTATFKLP